MSLVLLAVTGCGKVWGPPVKVENPGIEFTPTGAGALTGVVIGAGVGGIVGAAAGGLTEGLIFGTMAGGAMGTAVGYGKDFKTDPLQEQRAELESRQETIEEQGEELQRLRKGVGERYEIRPQNLSSRQSGGVRSRYSAANVAQQNTAALRGRSFKHRPGYVAISPAQVQGQVATLPESVGSASVANTPSAPLQLAKATKVQAKRSASARAASGAVASAKQGLPSHLPDKAPAVQPVLSVPAIGDGVVNGGELPEESSLPLAQTLPKAKETQGEVESLEQTIEETIAAETSHQGVGDSGAKVIAAKGQGMSEKEQPEDSVRRDELANELAKAVKSSSVEGACGEAESEAARGRGANSDADKLFYFRRAIRLCPDSAQYYVEIGKVYVNIGRGEEARQEFTKALEIDPDNEQAQEELSMMMLGNTY